MQNNGGGRNGQRVIEVENKVEICTNRQFLGHHISGNTRAIKTIHLLKERLICPLSDAIKI